MGRPKKVVEEQAASEEPIITEQETEVGKGVIESADEESNYTVEREIPIQEEKPESDEVVFLRRILHIQHDGGFGRHLDEIINERIKELNG
jgi:hypothetical protein